MKLQHRNGHLDLDRVAVMGILNVTPDSFSDGGIWTDEDTAVRRGLEMIEQGAALVDVGGESTRPGATPVSEEEELKRVLRVVERLTDAGVLVSIDTRKPRIAARALEAGAGIINDTSGDQVDRAMDQLAAETKAGVIVMHSRGTPMTMTKLTSYGDVVGEVGSFLLQRAHALEQIGVPKEAICLDPGFGFAKSEEQNFELMRRLGEILRHGYPVLAGTSRKSFIGHVLGLETDERLEGTLATVIWCVAKGARIVRVHDIEPVVRAVRMTEAIAASDSIS
jgi:dihydropteroate synthase